MLDIVQMIHFRDFEVIAFLISVQVSVLWCSCSATHREQCLCSVSGEEGNQIKDSSLSTSVTCGRVFEECIYVLATDAEQNKTTS